MEHSCGVHASSFYIFEYSLADILWLVRVTVVTAINLGLSQTPNQEAILNWIALNKANLSKYGW